jgi:hypothetical protein
MTQSKQTTCFSNYKIMNYELRDYELRITNYLIF